MADPAGVLDGQHVGEHDDLGTFRVGRVGARLMDLVLMLPGIGEVVEDEMSSSLASLIALTAFSTFHPAVCAASRSAISESSWIRYVTETKNYLDASAVCLAPLGTKNSSWR